jgi:hypothetical protein
MISMGRSLLLVAVPALAITLAPAQLAGAGEAGDDDELRRAVRGHFQNRLRAELRLRDEQFAAVWPKVEQLEDERRAFRRERAQTLRRLRRGYQGGAGDAELQTLLDSLNDLDDRQRARERELMAQVDAELTVRQRVELRFFVTRFRRQLQQRIETIRRERGGRTPDDLP